MSNVSIRKLRKFLHQSMEEQEKRNAEYDKWNAEFYKKMEIMRQDFGRMGISMGDQVEAMFVNLDAKFNALGYSFPKQASNVKIRDKDRKILAQVDHLLENGRFVMPVEVKTKLKIDDIDDHIKRLGFISEYNKTLGDYRRVIGAVAGSVVPDNVLEYAQKKGLYVLVQNGESVSVAALPADFAPSEW